MCCKLSHFIAFRSWEHWRLGKLGAADGSQPARGSGFRRNVGHSVPHHSWERGLPVGVSVRHGGETSTAVRGNQGAGGRGGPGRRQLPCAATSGKGWNWQAGRAEHQVLLGVADRATSSPLDREVKYLRPPCDLHGILTKVSLALFPPRHSSSYSHNAN